MWLGPARSDAQTPVTIRVEPFDSFLDRPNGQTQFGALRFLGGAVLSSPDRGFGGLSALRIQPETGRFVAVSDVGDWLTGRVEIGADYVPRFSDVIRAPLRDADGAVFAEKYFADAEGIAFVPGGPDVAVAFERANRVLIYGGDQPLIQRVGKALPVPKSLADLDENKGLEGIVARPRADGGVEVIGFAERIGEDGRVPGFILSADRQADFALAGHERFSVTDAALLPNGDVLVLERFFSPLTGPKMALRQIDGQSIQPGAVLGGDILLVADSSTQIDNMEALSVLPGADADHIELIIVSDDNFSPLQRTVWLHFELHLSPQQNTR